MIDENLFTVQREYIEIEQEFTASTLFIYTYKFARDSGRMHVLEYVDVSTGEIIPKSKANVREIRPEAMLERFTKLDNLRPEVRKFATFLLRFRNQACGFLVPVSTITKWYSVISNKRVDNIRRYLPVLIKKGILQDDSTPDKLFMVNNHNRKKSDAKGDITKAQVLFDTIRLRQRNNF